MQSFRRSVVLLWAVAFSASALVPQAWAASMAMPPSPDEVLEQSKQAYQQGRYDEALEGFQRFLLYRPRDAEAVAYIAQIERQRERERAIMESLTLAELKSQSSTASPSAAPLAPVGVGPPGGEREPSVAPINLPAPVRVGEIGLFVDGREMPLTHPIVVESGGPLVPLRDVAAALSVSVIERRPGEFGLVFPSGVTREVAARLIGEEPVLTEMEVRDLFVVDTQFDAVQKTFSIRAAAPQTLFETYTIPKPPEELKEEERLRTLAAQAEQVSESPGDIPEAARPELDLKNTVSYSYRRPHGGPPSRTLLYGVTGRAYDFAVRGESSRKDINGIFDHDYTYLNFTKPDLFIGLFDQSTDLYPLRGQSDRVTGAKIRKAWNQQLATTLVGGEVENTVAGDLGQVKYLGRLYELQQEVAPADWVTLKSGVIFTDNEANLPSQSGASNYPRRNVVSFTGTKLKLPQDVSLAMDAALASYEPDNETDNAVTDWNWRVGSRIDKERYNVGFVYEFVGDHYASIGNPANYQDYRGWNLFSSYRLTDAWSLSSNVLRYQNNVDGNPQQVTQENTAYSLSSNLQLPWSHSVNVSFNDFLANPSGGTEPGSSNRTKLYRIDYGLPFLYDTRLLVNAQHTHVRQPAASDSYSNGFGGSLLKTFSGGSSFYLSQLFTKSVFEDSADTLNATTSVNMSYQLRPTVNLYWNSSFTRDVTHNAKSSALGSQSSGVRIQLAPDTTLTAEYRVDSYDINRERWNWPRAWSVFVGVSQSLYLRSEPTFGVIDGVVARDEDANGRIEGGEPVVESAVIRLEPYRQATTAADGRFTFGRVVPGSQRVSVDVASLPLGWMALEPSREVTVGKRKTAHLVFPLVKAGSVTGRVFIDENGDGLFQDTEEPLEAVAVILSPEEQFRRTDSEGVFQFDYLLPGPYTLRVYREDLPQGYVLSSEEEVAVSVEPGQAVTDLGFAARLLTAGN